MPIAIAKIDRERSLAGLARRVYAIEGDDRAELQRRAEAALLKANPGLGAREAYRRGRPVRVPAVAGLRRTDVVERAAADGEGLTGETALRLQALESLVEDRFQADAETRKALQERLGDARFVREARKALPESREILAKTKERLAQEEEEAGKRADRLRESVAAAQKAVSVLDELAKKGGPR